MIFEKGVYDFSVYLQSHDRYLDIREWCGQDMTDDFVTKADNGRDHRASSYALLDNYYIGELTTQAGETVAATTTEEITTDSSEKETTTSSQSVKKSATGDARNKSPYNLALPLGLTVVIYLTFFFISGSRWGKRYRLLSRRSFNFFWNTILLLSLIPALGFGIFLMLRYRFPDLYNLQFDFLYWHAELSVVMGVVCLLHFIQRWRQYAAAAKKQT